MAREMTLIINFLGHNLTIVVMIIWNLFSIGLYYLNMNVIHLFVLFRHRYHAHCLEMDNVCLFILYRHSVVCMTFLFNNTWHSCLNNLNFMNKHILHDYWYHIMAWHEVCHHIVDFVLAFAYMKPWCAYWILQYACPNCKTILVQEMST